MRFGLKSAVVGAAAVAVLMASGGTSFAKLSDLDPASEAGKAAGKCFATIIKEGAKYAASHAKLIIKCKAAVIKGKGGSLASCNPLSGDAAIKASDAAGKLNDKIEGKCGGKDKLCGVGAGENADIPLADINWDIGTCNPLESQASAIAISDCSDIAPCLVDRIEFANHQILNDVTADSLDPFYFNKDNGKDDNKCANTVFKEVNKFYLAKIKTVGKCWQSKAKRKGDDFDDGDPCPETDSIKLKAKASIEKLEQKIAKGLCGKCSVENGVPLKLGDSNKDGVCDDKVLGVTDVAAGDLQWLSGLTCPNVTVPGSNVDHRYDDPALTPGGAYGDGNPANGANCGDIGVIDSLQEYIDCVTCVAEYKADCVNSLVNGDGDVGLGFVYPAECGLPATPTPTPTPTATPSLCGNGVLDVGEDCDASASSPDDICPNAGNGLQVCNVDCSCDCPTTVTFDADPNDPATSLDTGWTGFAFNQRVIGKGTVSVTLSGGDEGVAGKRDPTCGVMAISGPIQNPAAGAGQQDVLRCSIDSSIPCNADSDCPGSETCDTYFASRLPLSAGGVSACVTNRFTTPIVGTADIETGDSANTVNISSTINIGTSVDKPCDNCIGDVTANDGSLDGTCDGGSNPGGPCDVMGVSPVPAFNGAPGGSPNDICTAAGVPIACCTGLGTGTCLNGTSLDCPSSVAPPGDGVLPINLSNSTGTEALTVAGGASGPSCVGAAGDCLCDTCATLAAEPCNSDADCPGAIVGSCGGLRCLGGGAAGTACLTPGLADPACLGAPCGTIGEPTKPNSCIGGTCTAGACAGGPFNGFCGPVETFRGCLAPSDCPFPGDTCGFIAQPCHDHNGVPGATLSATGAPDVPVNDTSRPTLASVFCVPPTTASAINAATGLPGEARVTLTGDANGLP